MSLRSPGKIIERQYGERTVRIKVVDGSLKCPAPKCRASRDTWEKLKRHLMHHDGFSAAIEATCDECGDGFVYYHRESEPERGKFCSVECKDRANMVERAEYVCRRCGDTFTGRVDRDRRYCSSECARHHSIHSD